MDENRRFGRNRQESEERYGRYEEGFESGGAGRYAQSSELGGRESRGTGQREGFATGQGRYGQGSFGQGSYGRGSYGQSPYGQGGRYEQSDNERSNEDRAFDRSFGEEAWQPGERSGYRTSGSSRYEDGRSQNLSWGDRSGQQEWTESAGYRGEPRTRHTSRERGSSDAFRGGADTRSLGRWSSDRGEGADFEQQRYSGSYGLGYGGQQGESFRGQREGSLGSTLGRFFGKGPKGYTRSDERIKEQLSDQLEQNGDIDASEITVEVKQGEVTLEGTVSDRWMKRLAEDVAEDCPGVKQVHNRLRVEKGNGSEADSSTRSALLGGSSESTSSQSTSQGSSSKDRDSSLGSSSGSTPGSEKSSRSRSGL